MTLEIHSPKTKNDSNYGFSESVTTKLNQQAIIPILADSIYKNPLTALRELYNNEITACKKANLENQKITITFDTYSRELVLTGHNSLGISKEIFNKILSVMGNSGNTGNNAGSNIGYFGLGFFSHVKLSEKMIIHTKTKNEQWSFISKSGLSFEFLPKEFEDELKTTGTKLILTVKDEIDNYSLFEYIDEIVQLSPIKTEFYVDDEKQELRQFSSLKQLVKETLKDYNNSDYPDYSFRMYQEITEQYELFIIKQYPYNGHDINKSFLISSPINIDILKLLNRWESGYKIFLRIKNERDFKPHVSRDYLTQESENELINKIRDSFKIFKDDNPKIQLDNDDTNYEKLNIVDFFNNKEKFFYDYYGSLYCRIEHKESKHDLMYNMEKILDSFRDTEIKIKHVCLVSSLDDDEIYRLQKYGIILLQVSARDKDKFLGYFKGFEIKKELYKKYNIPKPKKENYGSGESRELKIHAYRYYHNKEFVIRTKNPSSFVRNFYELAFVRESAEADNFYKKSEIPKIPIIKDVLFLTQDGYKTLKDLDSSYIFLRGSVFRKYKPNYEKYAYLPKRINLIQEQLIQFYLDKDFYNYKKSINPFYEKFNDEFGNNDKIKKLDDDGILNLTQIKDIESYNLMMKIINGLGFGDIKN